MKKKLILNTAVIVFAAFGFGALNSSSTTLAMESKSNVLTLKNNKNNNKSNKNNEKNTKREIITQKMKLKNFFGKVNYQ